MIKAIVFDYFGVIVEEAVIGKYIIRNFSNPQSRLEKISEYSHQWDLGEMEYDAFNEKISECTDVPTKEVWHTFFENINVYQDTIELIKLLKKNYKIFLLSNGPKENPYRMLKNQNIENLFDEIIISAEHKMTKPNPKFYELMLSIGGIDASEAIFIDDRQINVDAGNNFGIKSLLFTDAPTLEKDLSALL